jgi:exopolyphosphatase
MGAFYRSVLDTKQNSLDLLTLDEILDRDFKDWTETAQLSGEQVKLGFCSSVKSVPWIIRKAGGPDKFLGAVRSFAVAEDRQLDVVIIMTAFTAGNGRFCRELFVCSVNENSIAADGVKRFVSQAAEQLGLMDWSLLDGDISPVVTEEGLRDELNEDSPLWRRLWVQTNVAASRKQVAPLLRTAMTNL